MFELQIFIVSMPFYNVKKTVCLLLKNLFQTKHSFSFCYYFLLLKHIHCQNCFNNHRLWLEILLPLSIQKDRPFYFYHFPKRHKNRKTKNKTRNFFVSKLKQSKCHILGSVFVRSIFNPPMHKRHSLQQKQQQQQQL